MVHVRNAAPGVGAAVAVPVGERAAGERAANEAVERLAS
jgi:hypothetical protein